MNASQLKSISTSSSPISREIRRLGAYDEILNSVFFFESTAFAISRTKIRLRRKLERFFPTFISSQKSRLNSKIDSVHTDFLSLLNFYSDTQRFHHRHVNFLLNVILLVRALRFA